MSIQFPSTGPTNRSQVTNRRGSSGAFAANGAAKVASYDPLIGKKVWTRWPEDNQFYEAVVTDYNPANVCLLHNVYQKKLSNTWNSCNISP